MMGFVAGLALYVEGKIDSALVSAIVGTEKLRVTVTEEGPKYGLANKVKYTRAYSMAGTRCFFLRDRDFDFDGVVESDAEPHQIEDQGWHWCRHEVENYLLEPEILARYLTVVTKRDITAEQVRNAVCEAAVGIRFYQAARWVVGRARRNGLPFPSKLETRPENVDEYRLPVTLGADESLEWAVTSANEYVRSVSVALQEELVREFYREYLGMFSEENCRNAVWVLHFCSGKDLFAALKPWFAKLGIERNTKKFVEDDLTPWVARNMGDLLVLVPEWQALNRVLRAVLDQVFREEPPN